MVCVPGAKWIWYNVKSLCKKFLDTCYVFVISTSFINGKLGKEFGFAVVRRTLEKFIGPLF
jgi:hypothetical protein